MDIVELLKSLVTLNIFDYLREVWAGSMSPFWIEFVLDLIGVVTVSTFCLLIVILLIWLERKVLARIQDRLGPNRVGKWGLLQTVADVLKLLTKEDILPSGADFITYNLAPLLTVMTALLVWAVLPFAPGVIGVDLNIGLFYILAVSSTSVVALVLAGWGSNNKYALLGAFRAVAQLVSYEVPMVLSLLIPILLASSMSTVDIIEAQAIPFVVMAPLSALIFFLSALAETNRTPFDLLEAESEIVSGFHVEYSGMKFGMFQLAEFVGALFMSGLFTTVYLGGWRFFGLENLVVGGWEIGNLLAMVVFFVKTFAMFFVFMWLRGTLPRVRIDQMLNFNWKFLVPLSLVLVLVVAVVEKLIPAGAAPLYRGGVHLLANLLVGFVTLELLRRYARMQRRQAGDLPAGDDQPGRGIEEEMADHHHAIPAAH